MLPRGPRQDRGTEAIHHPTRRGTQQDQLPRWCRSAPSVPECPRCCQPIGNGSPQGQGEERQAGESEPTSTTTSKASRQGNERGSPAQPEQPATRKRGKKRSQRQAYKPTKRGPPLLQGAGSRSPHHKFAPKNQQKVALGSFEKIFGKIFRWNVSG